LDDVWGATRTQSFRVQKPVEASEKTAIGFDKLSGGMKHQQKQGVVSTGTVKQKLPCFLLHVQLTKKNTHLFQNYHSNQANGRFHPQPMIKKVDLKMCPIGI